MSFISQPISITALLFGRRRSIGSFTGYVTTKEDTQDVLTITKHPIQDGAAVTDHAFKEPVKFSCQITAQPNAFSGVSLEEIYAELVQLQDSRVPFEIQTPKRTYKNMLINAIAQTTDKTSENSLALTMTFEEIIIVSIGVVTVQKSNQGIPQVTEKTKRTGRKSILNTAFGGNLQSVIGSIGGN